MGKGEELVSGRSLLQNLESLVLFQTSSCRRLKAGHSNRRVLLSQPPPKAVAAVGRSQIPSDINLGPRNPCLDPVSREWGLQAASAAAAPRWRRDPVVRLRNYSSIRVGQGGKVGSLDLQVSGPP